MSATFWNSGFERRHLLRGLSFPTSLMGSISAVAEVLFQTRRGGLFIDGPDKQPFFLLFSGTAITSLVLLRERPHMTKGGICQHLRDSGIVQKQRKL